MAGALDGSLALSWLEGTSINYLLMDGAGLEGIRSRAKELGIAAGGPPAGVAIVKGEWPGVQMPGGSGQGAGPTGVPWVDSNGWSIRLAMARVPESTVWVEAAPKNGAYRMAIADCAAHGGRWIITLDDRLGRRYRVERLRGALHLEGHRCRRRFLRRA